MNKWQIVGHWLNIKRFTDSPFWRWWHVAWAVYCVYYSVLQIRAGAWGWLIFGLVFFLYYTWMAWPTLMGKRSATYHRGPFKKGQQIRLFKSSMIYPSVGDRVLVLDNPPTHVRHFWVAKPADGKPIKNDVDEVPVYFGEFARAELFEE